MFNKTPSVSDKDMLIDILATKIDVPRDTINSVIQDTFMNLVKQMPNHNELEISGMGKFIFRPVAARKQLEKYQKRLDEGCYSEAVAQGVRENIAYIKTRLNE